MKKKLVIILFAFVMVFSLAGCGSNDEVVNDGTNTTTQEDLDKNDADDSIKDDIKDAGDAIKNGADDVGDAIRDGANDIIDGRDDVNDNMNDNNTHNN